MALSYVGGTAAVASSVSLPSFTTGDLAIAFAYRNNSNTAPSLPASGWTSIASSGQFTCAARIGYRVLQAGDLTSGTWTNATSVQVHVLQGQHPTTPIGNNGVAGANSNQISYAGFTLAQTNGTSWVLGMAGHRSATNVNSQSVSGMTTRSGSVTALGAHTDESVSTFATTNYDSTVNASSGWRSYAVEVRASNPKSTGTAYLSLSSGQDPGDDTDHVISLRARVTSAVSATLRARLYEAASARSQELETSALTTSLANYSLQVGTADAAGITSYANLELRVYGYSAVGDAAVFEIAEASLSIPPAAAGEVYGVVSTPLTFGAVTSGAGVATGTTQTGIARLSLESGFTPATRTDHSISIRARNATAARGTIFGALYESATPRSDWIESGTLGTSFAAYSLAIDDADAATISSYGDLELRLYGYSALGSADVYEVAEAALVLPIAGGGEVTGAAALSAITYVTVGEAMQPVYPGTAVYPHALATVAGTATITAAGEHEAFGQVVRPFTYGAITDGSTPPTNRQGWAVLPTVVTLAAVGELEAIGAATIESTSAVSAGATLGTASHSDSAAVAATTAITVAGNIPTPPLPADYVDLPQPDLPDLLVAAAFPSGPLDPYPEYTGISSYVRGISTRRGRQYELDRVESGEESLTLSNISGVFSPENTASPYYADLIPTRRVRFALYWGTASYDVFNGYLEGYPQEFPQYGADSLVQQRAVDAFMPLAMSKFVPGSTALAAAITTAPTETTTETVQVELTGLPMPQAVPFTITVDGEEMTVTEISGQYEYTVTRGGETATTHDAGAAVSTDAISFGEELTGQRIRNVLERIGLTPDQYDLEEGQTLLAPSENLAGQSPLEHLNFVAEVEQGRFFAARDGTLTFLDRHHYYKTETSARATFGEQAGELPYADIRLTHEQERIYNIVRITAADGTVAEVRDEASIDDHFERVFERQWPLANRNEAWTAARALLKRYARMQVRVPELTLLGQSDPDALWPVLLGMEIGQRYRVIRRPAATQPAIDDDPIDKQLVVEGIQHALDRERMETRVQMSLADTTTYWRLGVAGFSELGSTTRAGY